jgi:hypothetical protein
MLKPTDDEILEAVAAHETKQAAADALGMKRTTLRDRLRAILFERGRAQDGALESDVAAARRGGLGFGPVLPGFEIKETSSEIGADGEVGKTWVRQRQEAGPSFSVPAGHRIKGVSALVSPDGRELAKWVKTGEDQASSAAMIEAIAAGLRDEIQRVHPSKGPEHANSDLLNQYTITDAHLGMLALQEETRDADYDLKIAEKLLVDWFSAAIAMSPSASVAVLAQLGDLLHYDSLESVTPTNRHILDADTRFQRMVRVAIRVVRRIIGMLLDSHPMVHVVMASANHDPASSAWLREMLAVMYEDEPRVTIDISPGEYYAYEWGNTALFYHHGHRRKVENVDSVFASTFREIFGRCQHSYSHVGHLHSDAVVESNLMRNERHRTLAPKDAYAAGSGYLSKRDAKVITYHRDYGEVSRITLSPQMIDGWRNNSHVIVAEVA